MNIIIKLHPFLGHQNVTTHINRYIMLKRELNEKMPCISIAN